MPTRTPRIAFLSLLALLVLCFGLAAGLMAWFQTWQGNRAQSADVMSVLLGDSRKMFAGYFYRKSDVYFHSGFYPTIFDNREAFQTLHVAGDAGAIEDKNHGDEIAFLGKPLDWIDSFSRQFFPSTHTHLDAGGARGDIGDTSKVGEILPWLELSAKLDPSNIQTYTVTAYWLRQRMNKPAEAEKFLREGLRNNPGSFEILYELGRVFAENDHDTARAKNLWQAALKNWRQQEGQKSDPDKFSYNQIVSHLALQEEKDGNYNDALKYFELWKTNAASPQDVQVYIDEILRQHPSAGSPSTNQPAPGPEP